jgi:hypothetical protein
MPMSGAERQQRYRKRHHGNLARTTVDLRQDARDRLDRLAVHYGLSLVELVEELTASAERAVEAKLTGEALEAYRAGYEDDRAG